jgi:hypothetical protein
MRKVVPLERDVQAAIVDALQLAGFTVRHTSAFKQRGASGVSFGVPDLLVAHRLRPGLYMGLEVKRPGGALRPDQKAAVEAHEYALVESATAALGAAGNFLATGIQEGAGDEMVRQFDQAEGKLLAVYRALEKPKPVL